VEKKRKSQYLCGFLRYVPKRATKDAGGTHGTAKSGCRHQASGVQIVAGRASGVVRQKRIIEINTARRDRE
jgi:hypothetical protein